MGTAILAARMDSLELIRIALDVLNDSTWGRTPAADKVKLLRSACPECGHLGDNELAGEIVKAELQRMKTKLP